MEVHELPEALFRGKIDAFAAWEPIVTSAKKKYPGFVNPFQSMTTGYLYFRKEFSVEHKEAMRQVLAAVIRALDWLNADRQNLLLACNWNILESQKLTEDLDGLSPEELASVAIKDLLQTPDKIALLRDDLKEFGTLYKEFQFLKRHGIIPESTLWESVRAGFDTEIIESIRKERTKLKLNTFNYNFLGKFQ